MTPGPLVSVLIAARDAAPWLARTLESVLAQTWPRLEVIVVDDGSQDDTAAVARGFRDARVHVLSQEGRGAGAARNRAFAESRGEFVQYLDADDLLAPEKIERQVGRLERGTAGAIASGPWVRFHDAEGAAGDFTIEAACIVTENGPRPPDWHDYHQASDWLVDSWQGRGTMPLFAWLLPRAAVERAGPWIEELLLNDDGEYMARVLVAARSIEFCEGAWGFYRSGIPGSVSRRKGIVPLRSLFRATELCEATLLAHDDGPEARRACAGLWQQFLFTAYPDVPELVARAEVRVRELGGMYLAPGVIAPLRPVRGLFGWKAALRLQRLYAGLRGNLLRSRSA